MTSYRIISVADWGGTWKRPPQYEQPRDPEGFLHHTAGNTYDHLTAEQAMRELNRIAQDSKGYSFLDYDICYHYEKARDLGTIAWGRGEWMSAATRDRNELGEAVCVFGMFHPGYSYSVPVADHHIEGCARAFVELVKADLLAPDFVLYGHRSNPAHPGATACPGDFWYPGPIGQLRTRIDQLLAPEPPPPPPPSTEEPAMHLACKQSNGTIWVGDGYTRIAVTNWDRFLYMFKTHEDQGFPYRNPRTLKPWPDVDTMIAKRNWFKTETGLNERVGRVIGDGGMTVELQGTARPG